jgi:TonB family protein
MSLDLMWNNVVNYCLQIGLLIGVSAFLPNALRLTVPRMRLAFWHVLLAACLLLPLFAPKRHEVVSGNVRVTASTFTPVTSAPVPPKRPVPWTRIGILMLAGGAAIRLLWLCGGLWRLRQYRRRSRPLRPAASWAVEADLRISDDVTSPVTFGFLDPVVLLPSGFPVLDGTTQEAILCHEVLHVRRKDWLVTLGEEMVRCVFWFHPAIWWLLGEIALSREQAVDREVVEMTKAREEYVDALLAIAGAKSALDLAPAPLFLRKRHLKQRVVSILKEVRMSKTRSISALTAGLGILAAACWFVTMTFPLAAAPQTVVDGAGVTVDVGGSALMHRSSVMYPDQARRAKVEGTVVVEAMVDSSGNVVDARILSGPNELRRGVLQSVLQWHFANDTGANTRQVRVTFQAPTAPAGEVGAILPNGQEVRARVVPGGSAAEEVLRKGVAGGVAGGVVGGVIGGVPSQQSLAGKTLKALRVMGISDDAKSRLLSRLPVHEGDILADDSFELVAKAVRDYDEHMNVAISRLGPDGGIGFMIFAPGSNVSTGSVPMAPAPPPAPGTRRITIGGNVQSAKLISQAKPVYPPLAKQARISGTVNLAVIISADGNVTDIRVISGHPLLIPAALEAVKDWKYSPTLLNGEPVEVSTQVDINFTLSDQPAQQ